MNSYSYTYNYYYFMYIIIDTCDSAWQGIRDNLIISAFVLSTLALLSFASTAIVLAFSGKCIVH